MLHLMRLVLLILALAPTLLGGAGEMGIPFIRNFRPREYGAEAQNWAVVQDARGIVFVGNNQGVLEFDGARWRLITTPRGGPVRSLAVGPDGRVYVGALGEFGVLAPDASGRLGFSLLSGNLRTCPEFTDVWTTAATPRGMLFQCREALFLLEGGQIREWKAATSFHTSFAVDGRIFVREREVGLLELKGDGLTLVEGGARFRDESVFAMASLEGPDGAGGVLVGTRNIGLFRLAGGTLTPFPTAADAYLKANALYQGSRLTDGTLALATIRGGVLFLSPAGKPLGILDRSAGLMGDNVKQTFAGQGPSLWLALDTGIAQVEWPSPFTSFDDRLGLVGQVWDLARHRGILYAATGQGLSALDEARTPLPHPVFRSIEGLSTQCCCLLSMDGELLVGSSQGIYAVRGGRAVPLRPSTVTAIALLRSKRNPARVFAGLQGGFVTLRREPRAPGGWVDEGAIPGLHGDYTAMAEESDGTLWLVTGNDRMTRVRFPAAWKGGPDPEIHLDVFGADHGLEGVGVTCAATIRGNLAVGTRKGVFRFRRDQVRFEPHPLFGGIFADGRISIRAIREDDRGRIWMAATEEARRLDIAGFARSDGTGGLVWEARPFQRLGDSPVQAILPEPEGVVWFGGPGGVRRYDPATLAAGGPQVFAAQVRKVVQGGTRLIHAGETALGPAPRLAFRDGPLRFEFSAPAPGGNLHYQVHLDGFDRDWSAWSTEAQKEYTSLPAGTYTFRVRAEDAQGNLSAEASFPFSVAPPLFLAWWAWGVYALVLGSAVWAFQRTRTRRLLNRNAFLHARITEATWEVQDREKRLGRQAADLARMNAELRSLNQHKDQLMGIVAHDLRNPLSGLILILELVAEETDLDLIHQKIQLALKASEDMRSLIAHFLDISAIDAGRIRVDLEPLDAAGCIVDATARFAGPARTKGMLLEHILPEEPVTVLGDRRFLRETLDNLISNALKFSPEGSRITLRLTEENNLARFSVEDQGPGLLPDDHIRLFGRFARLSARPTGGESSVGLGLSIVKHLVETMGGRIWVVSEPGQGAAFKVELPLAKR